MVVPPAGGGSSTTTTTTTATMATTTHNTPVMSTFRASPATGNLNGTKVRAPRNSSINGRPPPANASIPLSARRSQPLDMASVERKGHPLNVNREIPKKVRPHGIQDAPTYYPTEDEFRDPFQYLQKIAPEGQKYGIIKVIPPDGWNPDFAIDTERFHFRTHKQVLNSVEGGTRSNLNYLDQLAKFHKQNGTNLTRFPSVDKRPLDLYKLKKAVEVRGGFETVCRVKKWAEIGRDLGYSGKIMSSLSTSLKNSYGRWLQPFEEYLRVAKPGVQHQLELENGGPLTPSPGHSPMKKSHNNTPSSLREESPTRKASAALHATVRDEEDTKTPEARVEPPRAVGGFTAVNAGGFTPVNPSPPSFTAVNAPNGIKRESTNGVSSSKKYHDSPLSSSQNTPEHRMSGVIKTGIGSSSNHLKRRLSHDTPDPTSRKEHSNDHSTGDEDADGNGRRSKRLKRDNVPTVAGSHMAIHRPLTPKVPRDVGAQNTGESCETCGKADDPKSLLICDGCDNAYHRGCLDPPVKSAPENDWHCPRCLVGTGEYGFDEGGVYSLRQFQEKAHDFKEAFFAPKMPYDPVLNCRRAVTEDDVEREFWRLVETLTETVEVEYGADIHSTTHGSGFPTIEKNPLDPYASDPWNLNLLPLHPESLFRHIKSDISGMTVPWLYVGMCFSTFCWHNEDHYTYSANYQHLGATKTWYGIPGEDAEKFEEAMRQAVPELFETQPDLLFQLVTLLSPEQLRKAGVRVYALDQRAGQFVITYPQAYHAGFNHGFNVNEAVNFAPHDWEPFGNAGVERLRDFRRQPCFSHDELLFTAAVRDTTIKTARWLGPALERLLEREMKDRQAFRAFHEPAPDDPDRPGSPTYQPVDDDFGLKEEDYQCVQCKSYAYLSRFTCGRTKKILCLPDAIAYECCGETTRAERMTSDHQYRLRIRDPSLQHFVQKVIDRRKIPELWAEKLDAMLENDPKPALKALRSLLSEGERIPYPLPQLATLRSFVERCNEWVEEATNYIVRKQQNRRKNEKAWRKGNSAKAAELEERDRELRKIDNIVKLLAEADEISFDCAEISQLRERADAIRDFQVDAQAVLRAPRTRTTQELADLIEIGRGFNVDVPEVEELDRILLQMTWNDRAREYRTQHLTLDIVTNLISEGDEYGIPAYNEHLLYYKEQKQAADVWEAKAKELMSVDSVHYQQLEALSGQAAALPVSEETLAAVDQILNKQRQAHRQIMSLYDRCKHRNIRDRPKYKEVREVMDQLDELHSKPTGTIDLERERKLHEDWMRRGKKLFGKANAPLHILLAHMSYVEQRNVSCLSTQDRYRPPAEPSSREHTPEGGESSGTLDAFGKVRDVFCICRQPESGMMIMCELCHEWYHGKCLKIARGKVKEDDKYTCPVCDWRVKIPRDAARPKLEALLDWQAEIADLPFQPDEEDCLARMIDHAQKFRDFIRPYTNPLLTTQEEVSTQRFYLRKIEGAEILLAHETNFFRQELHRWAPVAPEPPPVLEQSLSTRKPRPTKQQKLMAQLGIDNPDDLPQNLRTKPHEFHRRKPNEPLGKPPAPLQPAPPGGASSATRGPRRDSSHADAHAPPPPGTSSFAYNEPLTPNASAVANPMRTHQPGFAYPDSDEPSPQGAHAVDPTLFAGAGFGRNEATGAAGPSLDSPMGAGYGGGQNGPNIDSIFDDLTNQDGGDAEGLGTSHADDALAVTADGGGEGGDGGGDIDPGLTDGF